MTVSTYRIAIIPGPGGPVGYTFIHNLYNHEHYQTAYLHDTGE